MKTSSLITVGLLLTCGIALVPAASVLAYDDVTAHPAINECAWRVWWEQAYTSQRKPVDMRTYGLGRDRWGELRKLKGRTVTDPGEWPGNMQEGHIEHSVVEWVKDGGRTADAPHHFQSLRHFYDPTRREGERYLTDVPELARIFSQTKGRLRRSLGVSMVNPETDARHWALDGSSKAAGEPANRYSWPRGLEAMRRAFAEEDPDRQDALFALAWRVLGETMHLLADMTVPAHVRDDAHPMPQWMTVGGLRGDPYEDGILGENVMQVFNGLPRGDAGGLSIEDHVYLDLANRIRRTEDPYELFHEIAAYTNKNFFSADTVSGHYPGTDIVVEPGNGRIYPSPKLQNLQYDQHGNLGGYYRSLRVGASGSRTVMLLQETMESPTLMGWLRRQWHDRRTLDTSEECVMSQAQVLLPLAFMGCARLVDMYVPRVEVELTNLDLTAKRLEGAVRHLPHGAYIGKPPMRFTDKYGFHTQLVVNGRVVEQVDVVGDEHYAKNYKITINQGRIEGDLSNLRGLQSTHRVALRVHVGGLPIDSNEIQGEVPDGVWVLSRVERVDNPRLAAESEGATVAANSATIPVTSGKSYSRVPDPETGRNVNVPSERWGVITLNWDAPPASIPGGGRVALSYSVSGKETGQSGPNPPSFGNWGKGTISVGAVGPISPRDATAPGNPVFFERHALPSAEASIDGADPGGQESRRTEEVQIPTMLTMTIGNHRSERELRTGDEFHIRLSASVVLRGPVTSITWHYGYYEDPARAPAPAGP